MSSESLALDHKEPKNHKKALFIILRQLKIDFKLNGFSKTYLTRPTYLFIIRKFLLVTFKYTSTCKRAMSQKGQNPKVVLHPKRHGK